MFFAGHEIIVHMDIFVDFKQPNAWHDYNMKWHDYNMINDVTYRMETTKLTWLHKHGIASLQTRQ